MVVSVCFRIFQAALVQLFRDLNAVLRGDILRSTPATVAAGIAFVTALLWLCMWLGEPPIR